MYDIPVDNDILECATKMGAAAALIEDVHPILALQAIFENIELLFALNNHEIEDQQYMQQVFGVPYSTNVAEDPNLPGMLWSLCIDVFYLCRRGGYDVYDINTIMKEHSGWEYLACCGRHVCYDEPAITADTLLRFIQTH